MRQATVTYREYAPCEALRETVSAFFSFVPAPKSAATGRLIAREVVFYAGESFCSPLFASGHVSIVFSFPRSCRADGVWNSCYGKSRSEAIGAMSAAGVASLEERAEMIGAYLQAPPAQALTGAPAIELTDRIVPLEDLWGPAASELAAFLTGVEDEGARLQRLESAFRKRINAFPSSSVGIDVAGLAAYVSHRHGRVAIEELAQSAGVSRQHLRRVFCGSLGLSPKQYCRLTRFQAALASTSYGDEIDWAQTAVQWGYADQSHMIAEFRQFSSLTPESLIRGRWFHPFVGRAPGVQNRQRFTRQ